VISVLKLMGLELAVPDHTTLSFQASKWRSPDKWQDDRGFVPEKGPAHVLINSTGLQKKAAERGGGLVPVGAHQQVRTR